MKMRSAIANQSRTGRLSHIWCHGSGTKSISFLPLGTFHSFHSLYTYSRTSKTKRNVASSYHYYIPRFLMSFSPTKAIINRPKRASTAVLASFLFILFIIVFGFIPVFVLLLLTLTALPALFVLPIKSTTQIEI